MHTVLRAKSLETVRRIGGLRYAVPSLVWSLLMGFTTTVHHLHAGLRLEPAALHVVYNELVLIPATLLSMYAFARYRSRIALWVYLLIALLGFVGLGLYEGGWNHTAKIIGHLRIDSAGTGVNVILPTGNVDLWFHEITGVLTFVLALLASWFSWRFAVVHRASL